MKPSEVITRARRCLGHGCEYVLGAGGMHPEADFPFVTPEKGCDCSGFAMWCLGLSRFTQNEWWSTDKIVEDANNKMAGLFFFAVPLAEVRVGDLLVYPAQTPGHHGHVGVVSEVDGGYPSRVIHCSMGNWRVAHDAIKETGAGLWTLPTIKGMVVARFKSMESETA